MPDTSTEVALATTTLSSAAATITFSSISSAYTDLRLVVVAKNGSGIDNLLMRFNSDSGINYSSTWIQGAGGSSASSARSNNITAIRSRWSEGSTQFALTTFDIFSYAGSTNKTVLATGSSDINGAGGYVTRTVSLWRNTAAITSITLVANLTGLYDIGTTATLYGIL